MTSSGTLLLATRNRDKVREISRKLNGLAVEVKSLLDFPSIPDIVEDGKTIEENALKKAEAGFNATNLPTIADDTGLEVEALNGRPGIFSSRYAGKNVSYADNRRKLLEDMEEIPQRKRSALFRTVIAFVAQDRRETVEGVCGGVILGEERGDGGFGYDPVFYIPQYGLTFAQMPLELKNRISHRGIAMGKIIEVLKDYFG